MSHRKLHAAWRAKWDRTRDMYVDSGSITVEMFLLEGLHQGPERDSARSRGRQLAAV